MRARGVVSRIQLKFGKWVVMEFLPCLPIVYTYLCINFNIYYLLLYSGVRE